MKNPDDTTSRMTLGDLHRRYDGPIPPELRDAALSEEEPGERWRRGEEARLASWTAWVRRQIALVRQVRAEAAPAWRVEQLLADLRYYLRARQATQRVLREWGA